MTTETNVRRNKYAARCATCRRAVGEGQGTLMGTMGAWMVYHDECAPVDWSRAPQVRPGYYAFPCLTGTNDLDFARVFHDFDRGHPRAFRVIGGHPDTEVNQRTAFAFIEAIARNPQFYALLYAREIGRCCRCNRHLTDEESRARGMGPECASKP